MAKYDIYPLTIVNDRYRGTYSGGAFTAWNHSFHEIPLDIDCGDCTCRDFWWLGKARKYRIGVGDTIEAAIEALADVMRNKEGK